MKNQNIKKSNLVSNSKIAIAATMLSVPMFSMPFSAYGQETIQAQESTISRTSKTQSASEKQHYTIKLSNAKIAINDCFIVGSDQGHTVYKNEKGEFFYVEPKTGDIKLLSSSMAKDHKEWIKFSSSEKHKSGKVTLLGIDDNGNIIQENSRGEKFYLNPSNGDMIFVK